MKSPDPMIEGLRRQPACPETQVLGRLLEPSAETAELAVHVENCLACQTELALLRRFSEAKPTADEQADVEFLARQLQQRMAIAPAVAPPRRWFSFNAWTISAFASACALIVFILAGPPPFGDKGGDAADPNAPVYRGMAKVKVLQPPNGMTEPFEEIRWEEFRGAANYRAEIREVDGVIAWREESHGTQIKVDQRLRSVLLPGKRVALVVLALNSKNERIAESDPVQIRLEKPGH